MALSEQEELELLTLERDKAMSGEQPPAVPIKPRIDPASIVEPNAEQRRMGIRKNRIKDDSLLSKAGSGFLNMGEDIGRETVATAGDYGLSPATGAKLGFAADMGANLLPIPIGGAKTKLALQVPAQSYAKRVMQMALKPGKAAQLSGDAEKAITTLLTEEGARVSEGGVKNMTKLIDGLDSELDNLITNASTAVSTQKIVQPIKDAIEKFRYGLDQAKDKTAIVEEFNKFVSHPEVSGALNIPADIAQKIKRAIYRELGDKAYGLGVKPAAEMEGKKAVARGLREGIEQAVPETAAINERMSSLINARDLAESRAMMVKNNQIMGLGWLAHPTMWLPWLAERSPGIGSLLARSLHRGTPSGILGQSAVGGAELLNEATK